MKNERVVGGVGLFLTKLHYVGHKNCYFLILGKRQKNCYFVILGKELETIKKDVDKSSREVQRTKDDPIHKPRGPSWRGANV